MAKEAGTFQEVPEAPETTADTADAGTTEESKLDRAALIVSKYATASAAAGLLPLPLADVTLIGAVQMKMVHSLSKLYEVPFSSQWTRSLLASLAGGVASDGIGRVGLGSMLKLIPGIGHVASALALPGVAWATTSALGQVFTEHFAGGGTLLTLDLKVWRPVFREKVSVSTQKN